MDGIWRMALSQLQVRVRFHTFIIAMTTWIVATYFFCIFYTFYSIQHVDRDTCFTASQNGHGNTNRKASQDTARLSMLFTHGIACSFGDLLQRPQARFQALDCRERQPGSGLNNTRSIGRGRGHGCSFCSSRKQHNVSLHLPSVPCVVGRSAQQSAGRDMSSNRLPVPSLPLAKSGRIRVLRMSVRTSDRGERACLVHDSSEATGSNTSEGEVVCGVDAK